MASGTTVLSYSRLLKDQVQWTLMITWTPWYGLMCIHTDHYGTECGCMSIFCGAGARQLSVVPGFFLNRLLVKIVDYIKEYIINNSSN